MSLSESARVPWPTFFDSLRLKRYRLAGTGAYFGLTSVTMAGQLGPRGVVSVMLLVLFALASVPLSLFVTLG